jgi:hypothetical protein
MSSQRYLFWFFGFGAVFVLLSVALAVIADPYYVFGTPSIASVNIIKPRVYQQAEIAKKYQLSRIRPRTLLLGNSRVEIGLNPESSIWPASMRPVFNAALAGAGLDKELGMLRQSLASGDLRTVILGVDFADFLARSPVPIQVQDEAMPSLSPSWPLNWRDPLVSSLTISSLTDSFTTLFNQDSATGVTMTPAGFNPLHEYKIHVRRVGYRELFRQKLAAYCRDYARMIAFDPAMADSTPGLVYLRKLIDVALAHGIRVILFIHPYHGQYLDLLHELGFWESFESWKRSLSRLVEDERHQHDTVIRLFDFSGYNAFTTEPLPGAGTTAPDMRWYWEPGHYKSGLGELMLKQMVVGAGGFGTEIRNANIDNAATLTPVAWTEEKDRMANLSSTSICHLAPRSTQ